jgi:PAS domain S-box-containing protein
VQPRETPPDGVTAPPIGETVAQATAECMAFAANALPALIAYLDGAVRYVWVNEGYGLWFGRAPEQIIGRHASEVLGATAWAAVQPHTERALAGEEVAFANTVVKDGETRTVRASYVPHHDGSGRVRGFVALITDISEIKAVETALRRSERMLEQSQATAQVGSWEVILDEGLSEVPRSVRWSAETYRMLGYEPGMPASRELFYQLVHPDERESMRSNTARAVERREPLEGEYRIVRPDGNVRTIHAWLEFERAADGKTTRAFGTCQDITARRLADLEIRRARERLQLVVDSTPAFIASYNRDQRMTWSNKSYAARFGKTPDEILGCRLVDLVGEAAFRMVDPFTARVLAGESVEVEMEMPYATGARFLHMTAAPTRDAAGAVDGCVTVLTDVTDGRRLEQERERALSDLRDVDRRKDEFLAMLSHELRNPLGPILNAVEVLAQVEAGREALVAHYREVIERQARHMKRLLDDLLDVSRVSQGKIQLQRERVDLNGLLRQAAEVSHPMIVEKQHAVSLALVPQPLTVEADPTRLVQVFDNLINNAAKYTAPHGRIAINSAMENGEAVVRVRDDGVGMTAELLQRAFDLFVQGTRSLDRTQGGLGIGLTLVRTLVEMHGGSVRAFSDGPGRGSELVVRLPLAATAEPSAPGLTPAAPDGASAPLRVLVVDDNRDAAQGLGHLLQLRGHEVMVAYDGPAALAAAAIASPDLVLLDIGLPGMDGFAVAAQLRAAGHTRATLIAVTGYGREDDLRRSREAGFDHHLLKPIDFAQLQRLILELGGRRQLVVAPS